VADAPRLTPAPSASPLRLLSVVIPARDEEGCLHATVEHLHRELTAHAVPHEIVVVDDGSTDGTWELLERMRRALPRLRPIRNTGPHGFGRAVIRGLDHMSGDAVVLVMADRSEDPRDVVRYWDALNEGWECVFGTRFGPGGRAVDYPLPKLVLNRLANRLLQLLFALRLDDTTNAFKAYRRTVVDGCRPLVSPHFNLTVELPLKAVVRGYRWTVIPVTWRNRRAGVPKLRIQEMGSRYLFTTLHVWLEMLARGCRRAR